jgi:ferritin
MSVANWFMDDENSEIMFIKDIIQIVKVIGNKMNEGYVHKQDMKRFNLEVLNGTLFRYSQISSSLYLD